MSLRLRLGPERVLLLNEVVQQGSPKFKQAKVAVAWLLTTVGRLFSGGTQQCHVSDAALQLTLFIKVLPELGVLQLQTRKACVRRCAVATTVDYI